MKSILLLLWCLAYMALAETVTLAWDANPPADNVTAYELRYGTDPANLTGKSRVAGATQTAVELAPGIYHFVVVAITASGIESLPSARVTHTVRPGAPQRLRVILQSSADLESWDDELEVLNKPPGRKFWRIQTIASN